MIVLRKSFYIHWSAGRSPRVHEVNPGRGPSRKATEAASSAKRLTKEYCGLRGDLYQQITLVAQRNEVIGRLRDQASTQWASGWLAFQQKVANAYPGLDFNFDLPSDEEAEESFSVDPSGEPDTPTEAHSPSSDV